MSGLTRRKSSDGNGRQRVMAKYGNRKVEADGVLFDSQAEYRRYRELRLLQDAGEIDHLVLQPAYVLAPAVKLNGRTKPAIRYFADFQYVDTATGKTVTEDVKSPATSANAVYRVKKHLLMTVHGIEVREV